MIVTENLGNAERRYSDQGVKIRQVETDTVWNDAINAIPCLFTYEETNIPVDNEDIDDTEALNIIMGRAQNEET